VGRGVAGPRVGLAAAGIVACSPLLVAADGSLMSESLYVMLVTAAVLAAYRARHQPGVVALAVVGVVGGLAVLTRSDGIFVVPLLVLASVVPAPALDGGVSGRRRVALAAVGLGVAMVVVVPWTVRNTMRLDQSVALTSNAGSVLEGANCETTYGGDLLGAWDPTCLTETRRPDLTEAEWADAGRAEGLAYARDHVERVPLVVGARVARTLGLWDPIDGARLEAVESRHERWQLAGWFYGIATLVVAVPGTVLLVRRRAEIGPLVAVVVGVMASVALAWGNQRFRLAAEPVIAVAAATAIAEWVSLRAPRRPVSPHD
jgi:4-amino-4-deoxy-L-arabinose transferase-like glycosyltransferase